MDQGRLAVLIQQLVGADVSAVVFSADPVSGDREVVVVNATWRLGESILGGTVSPDEYRVRKADLKAMGRRVADKERMTVAVRGGDLRNGGAPLCAPNPRSTKISWANLRPWPWKRVLRGGPFWRHCGSTYGSVASAVPPGG
ncbi:MAG: hypothetical protein FJY95_04580 [Candidatus Handelsmanbacteria bacterium]|nr:hypothetical protein [Candidatus Handelsmanbacteria bacterium]